nr:LOW QUALITY PROTEIN: histone-lysine N-methyltransferase EHMT1-like [Rhipicephalus microplus]
MGGGRARKGGSSSGGGGAEEEPPAQAKMSAPGAQPESLVQVNKARKSFPATSETHKTQRRRFYRGGTYGLYLSSNRRKRRNRKAGSDGSGTSLDGEATAPEAGKENSCPPPSMEAPAEESTNEGNSQNGAQAVEDSSGWGQDSSIASSVKSRLRVKRRLMDDHVDVDEVSLCSSSSPPDGPAKKVAPSTSKGGDPACQPDLNSVPLKVVQLPDFNRKWWWKVKEKAPNSCSSVGRTAQCLNRYTALPASGRSQLSSPSPGDHRAALCLRPNLKRSKKAVPHEVSADDFVEADCNSPAVASLADKDIVAAVAGTWDTQADSSSDKEDRLDEVLATGAYSVLMAAAFGVHLPLYWKHGGNWALWDPNSPSRLWPCSCNEPSQPATENQLHCQGLDSLQGKVVGCTQPLESQELKRASVRMPFGAFCDAHDHRLQLHHCCPHCGVFCTQGDFVQCTEGHLWHSQCQQNGDSKESCPHCGRGGIQSVRLEALGNTLFQTSQQTVVTGLFEMDVHNTLAEIVEAQRSAQLERLSGTKTGRTILDSLKIRYHGMRGLKDALLRAVKNAILTETLQAQFLPCPVLYQSSLELQDHTMWTHQNVMRTPRACMRATWPKQVKQEPSFPSFKEEEIQDTSVERPSITPARRKLDQLVRHLWQEASSSSSRPVPQGAAGTSVLLAACRQGDVGRVVQCLSGREIGPADSGALHAAAQGGHLILVHMLVKVGLSVHQSDDQLYTPLMRAVDAGAFNVVEYLLKAGADPFAKGEDGMSCLHLAARFGSLQLCQAFLEAKLPINDQDEGGWTPLVWATEHRRVGVVQLLLSKGADPNLRDSEGNTALHWSAYSGNVKISWMYLERGCDPNARNVRGDTPLHVAARQDNYDVVLLLMNNKARWDIANKLGHTPMECCKDGKVTSYTLLSINQKLGRLVKSKLRVERVLHRDISKGKERHPIECVNGVDDEPAPSDFLYMTENCQTAPVPVDRNIATMQRCKCEDKCTSEKCTCSGISHRCWYDENGILLPEFDLLDPPMLFECNQACTCWNDCRNRVVQKGITCHLQLFRTQEKGWGVRTLQDIPQGAFVCEYVGEMLSDSEADKREADVYLFDLEDRDGETYCLDARHYGNVCRFVNHLCEPNLAPVRVFVEHQDMHFPRMAFFSLRPIARNEELGFDYGEKFWTIKSKMFTCKCGHPNCKYSKERIGKTLKNYKRREKAAAAQAGGNAARASKTAAQAVKDPAQAGGGNPAQAGGGNPAQAGGGNPAQAGGGNP